MIILSIAALFLASIIFGLLGPLVIWKKTTYFGDGIAHSLILGVVLSSIFDFNFLIFSAILFSLAIIAFSNVSRNSLIGMMSQAFVSIALILKSIFDIDFDLESTLFGDLLLTDIHDINYLCVILVVLSIWMRFSYKNILLSSLNKEMSNAYTKYSQNYEYSFLLILALVIASSVKIFGVLMVTSMLLIPAINAKIISANPKSMILNSIILSFLMNIAGFGIAYLVNLPVSPSIICCGLVIFLLFQLYLTISRRKLL
jgi:zinc transport system permease protein